MQHLYTTFAQCLLEVCQGSSERTRALHAFGREPTATRRDADGTQTVTYCSPIFTLIIHRSTAGTWGYVWTWTDAL